MSAKRPRPAIPVLVHVDNPAEVGSVTVDTSTIEGKMDTVITNQNRIYDKIPTSSGGGSADLTTVNEKITTLATAIGPASSTSSDDNIFGHVRNLQYAVGDSTKAPSASGNSVRDLLTAAKENTNTIKNMIGTNNSSNVETSLIGAARNLVASVGAYGGAVYPGGTTVRSYLANLSLAVGSSSVTPTATETTVRGLLTAIKENTASGGGGGSGGSAELTTVNEKTTALAEAIGSVSSTYETGNLLGRVKNISRVVGDFNVPVSLNDIDLRSILYNIRTAIGSGSATPTLTGTSVRDLLTAIKENTASGGGGGGGAADLTTVNEKTTALATAIGSASDDASTVSVIGLLKSITDKY